MKFLPLGKSRLDESSLLQVCRVSLFAIDFAQQLTEGATGPTLLPKSVAHSRS